MDDISNAILLEDGTGALLLEDINECVLIETAPSPLSIDSLLSVTVGNGMSVTEKAR